MYRSTLTPMEFARQHLSDFKVKGNEIVPTHCPFCHGGQRRDKHTFALNIENGTYNCKRGSCGVQGHFTQLCREFGVESMDYIPPKKTYKKPAKQPMPLHEAAMQYIAMRCISAETAAYYGVGVDEQGNLMFPFRDEKGEHVFTKYRHARKLTKDDRKAWRDADTMPILYGMDKCDTTKPLTITEGEFDALACHEAGIPNAVSVPSGAEDFTWLDTCWDFIQQFEAIYLYGDNDAAGQNMINRLAIKLGDKRIFVVQHECKDANELLLRQGKEAVLSAWMAAKELPVYGLLNLAEVTPLDIASVERVMSSIAPLNYMIGGFCMGDVSVFTGKRGEGKSTLLSQLMLDTVDGGVNVCAYSGELRADRYQYWTDIQAAGRENVKNYYDAQRGREVSHVPVDIREKIHAWYNGHYWLYDNSITTTEEAGEDTAILKVFETAAKRFDCRMFLVDNLMTADFGRTNDSDFYRRQSRFVGQLVSFANKFNVHVCLVAHPRKTKGALENDDVSGSGDITNRVANVFTLAKEKTEDMGCGLALNIVKNRWEGNLGAIALDYCEKSRRLYVPSTGNIKRYGWEERPAAERTAEQGDLPW